MEKAPLENDSPHHQHGKHGEYKIRNAVLVDAPVDLGEASLPEPHNVDGDRRKDDEAAHGPSYFTQNLRCVQRLVI